MKPLITLVCIWLLSGCVPPTDPYLKQHKNEVLMLRDASGNTYSAKHLDGNNWELRIVK